MKKYLYGSTLYHSVGSDRKIVKPKPYHRLPEDKYLIQLFFSVNLAEMTGELFLPLEMPEPPKEGFFKGLFGGGIRSLDREELCKLLTS